MRLSLKRLPGALRSFAAAHVVLLPMLSVMAASFCGPARAETLSHGYYKNVQIDRPAGTPTSFVIWLGREAHDAALSQTLVRSGSMVARVDTRSLTDALEVDNGPCLSADGTLENLSRHIQAFYKLPTYLTPIFVGDGPGASLAYAMAAQSQPDAVVGVVSLDFCPVFEANKPLCRRADVNMQQRPGKPEFDMQPIPSLKSPWVALQKPDSSSCGAAAIRQFIANTPQAAVATVPVGFQAQGLDAAVASLARHQIVIAPPPASLSDLPLIEVPATPITPAMSAASAAQSHANAGRMAILLSGDGGWAEIDKGIAASLADQGIPVAGFDSLRYFWSKRTPEGLAHDLDRMIRFYSANWKKTEVILVGFSQGADVLPFAVSRLPAATRARVRLTALLGLGEQASFEFHVTNWLGPSGDRPIAPEMEKLSAADTLCVQGDKEPKSLCPQIPPAHTTTLLLPGNHHFNGAYALLASLIAKQADKADTTTTPR